MTMTTAQYAPKIYLLGALRGFACASRVPLYLTGLPVPRKRLGMAS